MEGSEIIKTKKAPSGWAIAVAKHIKAGGKFPKKGTADYDAVKALMGSAVSSEAKTVDGPVKVSSVVPKKTARAKKAPTAEAVVGDVASEKIVEASKELPIMAKPKKVRAPRAKVVAGGETAKPAEVVVGIELPTAHVMPLARLGATHAGIKLPFSL